MEIKERGELRARSRLPLDMPTVVGCGSPFGSQARPSLSSLFAETAGLSIPRCCRSGCLSLLSAT